MSNLAFFSADMLGMTLYQVNGGLSAKEVRQVPWGPWRVELETEAVSDLINGREMTFWLTLAGKVKMYAVVRDKECWMIVLDMKALKKIEKQGMLGLTLKDRIIELKPAALAFYQWKKEAWSEVSLKDGSLQGVGV